MTIAAGSRLGLGLLAARSAGQTDERGGMLGPLAVRFADRGKERGSREWILSQ